MDSDMTASSASVMLQQGMSLHRAGRLNDAVRLYGAELERDPGNADAWCLLGIAANQIGEKQQALDLIAHAIGLRDGFAGYYRELGTVLQGMGRLTNAADAWTHALKLAPDERQSYLGLLGMALTKQSPEQPNLPLERNFAAHVPPYLQRLQIEVTTWCNLKCAGCPRTIAINDEAWINKHMPVAAFRQVVDTLPPSRVICLQGVGESTLHPDFLDLVAIARGSGKYDCITLNTNGLARDRDYYVAMRAAGVDHVSLSIDSLDPDIAAQCRAGTRVDKLASRLDELHELFGMRLTVSIVVSRRNRADLASTLAALNARGPMTVEMQTLIVYDEHHGDDSHAEVALSADEKAALDAELDSWASAYPNLRLAGVGNGAQASPSRCARPFVAPFVTVDGFLTPCCTIQDPAVLGFTSVLDQTFAEAWRQPAVQRWLDSYLRMAPDLCRGCCFFTG